MTDWLLDTLVWTGALIALVLVLRRPVAQWFGARAAYALWAIPALRLVLPPITLPAWMNPSPQPAFADLPAEESLFVLTAEGSVPVIPAAAEPAAGLPVDFLPLMLAAWLTGAAVFLLFRFRAYFTMRREMLEDAREVGEIRGGAFGPIRLVETPATNGPLAFGVRDRVIALPPRFLATTERPVRDLALAHEIAHHRGGDLFVNFAVQPLFALHWFNPLGWVGWHAMRRDQEAACDARVVGTADAEMRATYAQTIASFAAGPRVALAAPMACPVLGDKSIIQRLRNLTMTDISPRRRWTGRALLLTGALALPLTASISYAEIVPEPPAAPLAPHAPTPPDPPHAAALSVPPVPPVPPAPFSHERFDALFGAEDGEPADRHLTIQRSGRDANRVVIRRTGRDGREQVIERDTLTDEQAEAIAEQIEEQVEAREREIERMERRIEREIAHREKDIDEQVRKIEKHAEAIARRAERVGHSASMIAIGCGVARAEARRSRSAGKHAQAGVCVDDIVRDAQKLALVSLRSARSAIVADRNLSESERDEALAGIDEAIAGMRSSS